VIDALKQPYEDQKAEEEAQQEERKAQLAQQESGANYVA